MRKILVVVAIFFLIYLFFYFRRIEMVDKIYKESVSYLKRENLQKAIDTLNTMDDYSGHNYLKPKIQEAKEKFYKRVASDMIAMAEEKAYRENDDYNVTGAYIAVRDYDPEWFGQVSNELSKIIVSQYDYFIETKDEKIIDAGKSLCDLIKKDNDVPGANLQQLEELRDQMFLHYRYMFYNWEGQYKMEMRNGRPYYYDAWVKKK